MKTPLGTRHDLRRSIALIALTSATMTTVFACSDRDEVLMFGGGTNDGGAPRFVEPDAGDGANGEGSVEAPEVPLCVSTECPEPYASCSDKPSFLCTTNLKTDPQNCGACGVSCTGFLSGLNMAARCVNGKCAFECLKLGATGTFRDCNGVLDDGCETDVAWDEANCGSCGHACAPGVRCVDGKCGCPAGKVDCNEACIDVRFDPDNCNACGNVCEDPVDACEEMPPNTVYSCVEGECGKLACTARKGDCNHDLNLGCASDGCETDLSKDTSNCGGCGVVCAPGQECRSDGNGPECLEPCATAGMAQCSLGCRDLRTDLQSCGSCGNSCPRPRPNQISSCKKGVCATDCMPGFADCNQDPADGCEVDLSSHPANCGACGNECNFADGQPCIEGKCLMGPCDAGVVTR